MTNNQQYNHFVIFALILIVGLGLAFAMPWLANAQGLAAKIAAPSAAGPCWATFNDGATYYNTADASAVQAAVDGAATGDVVKLAGKCEGVVAQGGTLQTVYISKDLTLEGGHTESDWTLEPDPDTYTTTLDADDDGRVIVISGTIDVTLDSLFLTGGLADANLWSAGGGIWSNGVLTLTNSIVYSNTAPMYGGGMFNYVGSRGVYVNVTFSDNKSRYGGGMYNYRISPTTMTDVNFFDNKAGQGGGGMMNEGGSNPDMTNITFEGNWADYDGGGLYNIFSSPVMTNTLFSGNKADHYGGGLFDQNSKSTLINATFSGNFANEYGGGIFNYESRSRVYNGIFWNNRDISSTGIISANIFNDNSIITLTNSLVEDSGGSGSWALDPTCYVDGGDNIDEDPMFVMDVDPSTAPTTTGNLRLGSGSPAIDAGDNTFAAGVLTDLDGEPRIVDGNLDGTPTIDMGAYETQIYVVYLPLIFR